MKLGIIFTGGTIGCQLADDGYLSLPEHASYLLLQGAEEQGILKGITVIPSEPLHLFSEQMTGESLSLLVNHMRQRILTEDCDGWILLHGSDTLAYTAAVLGYALGTELPPLVLVASNEPLTNPAANGWSNFAYAVRFLQEQAKTGVFVSHCNQDKIPVIHEATRLLQQLPGSGDLYSFCDAVYGVYDTEGQFHQRKTITPRKPLLPLSEPFQLLQPAPLLQLTAAVGNSLSYIPVDTKAILYQCYHSGTVCTDSVFLSLANTAAERHIPFFLTGCRSDQTDYDTKKQWETLSVKPLYDIAPIAAYCQLWIAVSNGLSIKDCFLV